MGSFKEKGLLIEGVVWNRSLTCNVFLFFFSFYMLQYLQLNPSRVEKGSNVAENLQQLIKFLEEITSNVFNSKQECPKWVSLLLFAVPYKSTCIIKFSNFNIFSGIYGICFTVYKRKPNLCGLKNQKSPLELSGIVQHISFLLFKEMHSLVTDNIWNSTLVFC